MSDPFEAPYWNLLQILAWVYLGDRSLVRDVADEPRDRGSIEVWERTAEGEERVNVRRPAPSFMKLSVAGHGEDSPHYPSLKKAMQALSIELQNGSLTFLGRRGGRGELEAIPAGQWSDLWFYDDPVLVASKSYPLRGAIRWDKVRGRREEVLAIWPDELAEGNKVEPATPLRLADDGLSLRDQGKHRTEERTKQWFELSQEIKADGKPRKAIGIARIIVKRTNASVTPDTIRRRLDAYQRGWAS